jgi:hypothetical protein
VTPFGRIAAEAIREQRMAVEAIRPAHLLLRLVKGGPWVPAIIYQPCPFIEPEPLSPYPPPRDWCQPLDRSPNPLRARIGDGPVIEDQTEIDRLWAQSRFCSANEYRYRLRLREWAVRNAPRSPEAQPGQAVDLNRQPSLF